MSFPPGTEMFQFPGFASRPYGFRTGYPLRDGLPHSDISGSTFARNSPELIAACYVLHRLLAPRHPPNALTALDLFSTSRRAARFLRRTNRRTRRPRPALGGPPRDQRHPRAEPKTEIRSSTAFPPSDFRILLADSARHSPSDSRRAVRRQTSDDRRRIASVLCRPCSVVRPAPVAHFPSSLFKQPKPPKASCARPLDPFPGSLSSPIRIRCQISDVGCQNAFPPISVI